MTGSNSSKLLNEQIFSSPPTVSLENLHPGDASNRDIAVSTVLQSIKRVCWFAFKPYALEATCPTHQKKRRFFQFAAVVCEVEDAVACLVFGLHENTLFAYAGHFLVTKEKILNPATRKPPDALKSLPDSKGNLERNLSSKMILNFSFFCRTSIYQSIWGAQQSSHKVLELLFTLPMLAVQRFPIRIPGSVLQSRKRIKYWSSKQDNWNQNRSNWLE